MTGGTESLTSAFGSAARSAFEREQVYCSLRSRRLSQNGIGGPRDKQQEALELATLSVRAPSRPSSGGPVRGDVIFGQLPKVCTAPPPPASFVDAPRAEGLPSTGVHEVVMCHRACYEGRPSSPQPATSSAHPRALPLTVSSSQVPRSSGHEAGATTSGAITGVTTHDVTPHGTTAHSTMVHGATAPEATTRGATPHGTTTHGTAMQGLTAHGATTPSPCASEGHRRVAALQSERHRPLCSKWDTKARGLVVLSVARVGLPGVVEHMIHYR